MSLEVKKNFCYYANTHYRCVLEVKEIEDEY